MASTTEKKTALRELDTLIVTLLRHIGQDGLRELFIAGKISPDELDRLSAELRAAESER